MKRFFDYLYVKENSTPFDTIALSVLNGAEWKKFEIRSKSKVETDKDSEVDMGDGSKKITAEKADFEAIVDLTPEDYATLRTFKNKKCTLILLDTDNPDANGDFIGCPAVFGTRFYPKKSVVSNEDCTVTITANRAARELTSFQRDITVTN